MHDSLMHDNGRQGANSGLRYQFSSRERLYCMRTTCYVPKRNHRLTHPVSRVSSDLSFSHLSPLKAFLELQPLGPGKTMIADVQTYLLHE